MSDDPPRRGPVPPGGPIRRAPMSGDVVPSRRRPARDPDEIDENPSDEDMERFGDPTRTCPECGKQVYDDAAICYHCGHAFERTTAGSTKGPKWVVAVVIVIIAAFVIGAVSGLF